MTNRTTSTLLYLAFVAGAIILLSTGCSSTNYWEQRQAHHSNLRDIVAGSVVKVTNQAGTGGGTGFYVKAPSGAIYLLTNAHVCRDDEKEGRYVGNVPVVTIDVSPRADICLMSVPRGIDRAPAALDMRDGPPYPGELVSASGYPQLFPLAITTGEYQGNDKIMIADTLVAHPALCGEDQRAIFVLFGFLCLSEYEAYVTTVLIQPGNSGSPLVDQKGSVVGIMFAGDENGRGFAVPFEEIKLFLEGR